MLLVRYAGASAPGVGVLDHGTVTAFDGVRTMAELLRLSMPDLRSRCTYPGGRSGPIDEVRLLPPIDGRTEVWAAGVTHERSRDVRMAESEQSDAYARVYEADRPELFFKSTSWKVVGTDESVAVRPDSTLDVPEPELAVVVNSRAETVGYTICDDVSSRSIEGANPLYLPQAKVFLGGCAMGPGIRPAWEIPDPYELAVTLRIDRAGETVWRGSGNTGAMRRRIDELIAYLHRADIFPEGVVLSTGTSVVPAPPFTLRPGDEISIEIDSIGILRNPVVRGSAAMRWLADR